MTALAAAAEDGRPNTVLAHTGPHALVRFLLTF